MNQNLLSNTKNLSVLEWPSQSPDLKLITRHKNYFSLTSIFHPINPESRWEKPSSNPRELSAFFETKGGSAKYGPGEEYLCNQLVAAFLFN